MSDPLGLSIGTTNLVAARVGSAPVTRRSVLPLSGQVLSGFVERVGDPVPLVTADGTPHSAEVLMVEALDAMTAAAGGDVTSEVAVAVPAHWTGATLRALRDAMRATPSLAPGGTPVRLVSDAVASLHALAANPGLPTTGVVALLDFGGGGTSITLADASTSFEPIETTRLTDFSGDLVDQALLARVLGSVADDADPAGTASVGSLTLLREECRRAKEELSESTVAEIGVELPGHPAGTTITRDELDALIREPLTAVFAELEEALVRNRITPADVSAVIAVGGGARIPLVTRLLSESGRALVVTTPHPTLDAAVGAALFAAYGADADLQTGVAAAALITGPAPAAVDSPDSATFRALAWSQDDETVGDPAPYTGEDPYADPYATPYADAYDTSTTRAVAQYHPRSSDPEPSAWQRLPKMAFGLAAAMALVAAGGVAIALTSATGEDHPAPKPAPVTASSAPVRAPTSAQPVLPPPTEVPPPSVASIPSEAPAPPPPPPPSTETVTVERPATTTITTTQPTTTTATTTTTPPPTTTTTITTTTTTTSTTTSPSMTTSYITVPFVPVPIPVQVPASPTQPQYPQYPQYPQQPQYQQQPQYPQQPQFPY